MSARSPPGATSVEASFWADLAWARAALARQPAVLAVTLAAWLLWDALPSSGFLAPLDFAMGLFVAGWSGAQRVFFQRQLYGIP
jgi:hypothetical protein